MLFLGDARRSTSAPRRRPAGRAGLRAPILLGLLAAALPLAGSLAAIAPQYLAEMRRNAVAHLQVEVHSVERLDYGMCQVQGVVARSFRDATGILRAGAPVGFAMGCLGAEDDMADLPVGGDTYFDLDQLRQAAVLEVFLDHSDGIGFYLADHGDGVVLLAKPTKAPQVDADP